MSLSTKNMHPDNLERLDGRRGPTRVEGQLEVSCLKWHLSTEICHRHPNFFRLFLNRVVFLFGWLVFIILFVCLFVFQFGFWFFVLFGFFVCVFWGFFCFFSLLFLVVFFWGGGGWLVGLVFFFFFK